MGTLCWINVDPTLVNRWSNVGFRYSMKVQTNVGNAQWVKYGNYKYFQKYWMTKQHSMFSVKYSYPLVNKHFLVKEKLKRT